MPAGDRSTIGRVEALRRQLASRAHVWLVDPGALVSDGCVERLHAHLSVDERRRLAGFRFERDRLIYLVAHGVLREILSLYADVTPRSWRFAHGTHGKPRVAFPAAQRRLCFNLAHTDGGVAVILTASRACGVDVEKIVPHIDADLLSDAVLSAAERRCRPAAPGYSKVARFLESWTLKEAYLKGIGLGIVAGMNTIEVRRTGGNSARVVSDPTSARMEPWVLRWFHLTTGHVLATAVHDASDYRGAMTIRRVETLRRPLADSPIVREVGEPIPDPAAGRYDALIAASPAHESSGAHPASAGKTRHVL